MRSNQCHPVNEKIQAPICHLLSNLAKSGQDEGICKKKHHMLKSLAVLGCQWRNDGAMVALSSVLDTRSFQPFASCVCRVYASTNRR
jgi:hypothetical protein